MANPGFQVTGNGFQGVGQKGFQYEAAPPTTVHYGVTAGPGMSVASGVVHLNAHGVGGNQTGNDGIEGIPNDAPR